MKGRYYGFGRSTEITVNGIEYRGAIPTIRDRETGKDLADAVSHEARNAIVAALNDGIALAEERLRIVDKFSEVLAEVFEWQKNYAPENDALTTILKAVSK